MRAIGATAPVFGGYPTFISKTPSPCARSWASRLWTGNVSVSGACFATPRTVKFPIFSTAAHYSCLSLKMALQSWLEIFPLPTAASRSLCRQVRASSAPTRAAKILSTSRVHLRPKRCGNVDPRPFFPFFCQQACMHSFFGSRVCSVFFMFCFSCLFFIFVFYVFSLPTVQRFSCMKLLMGCLWSQKREETFNTFST
jgi:hypothetical protein